MVLITEWCSEKELLWNFWQHAWKIPSKTYLFYIESDCFAIFASQDFQSYIQAVI